MGVEIVVSADTIIKTAGVLTALGVLIGLIVKLVHWFDRQSELDNKLAALEAKHDSDKEELRSEMANELEKIYTEQSLLVYAALATLKGQQELGCNGPVTEAVNRIEKHINKRAHEMNGGYFYD